MADEPILCFDGDKAGIRAAGRAADLALPLIQPGKSLRFALLPEGQDPDDLIRNSGREAMAEVLAAARPLVDLLWSRETEHGVFDTPERRAALEARLREIARAIARRERPPPLPPGLRRARRRLLPRAGAAEPRLAARAARAAAGRAARTTSRRPGANGRGTIPVSDRLTRTGMLAGRAGLPLREVVLVATMLNHPALILHHLDQFAQVELDHAGARRVPRRAARDRHRRPRGRRRGDPRPAGAVAVFGASVAARRPDRRRRPVDRRRARPADDDAESGWLQALTLHRRQRTLHKELRDAEAALADEPSEANLARLVDIQKQLANAEGTEALIEGFGSSSGRQARVL